MATRNKKNDQSPQSKMGSQPTDYPDPEFFYQIPPQHQPSQPGVESKMMPRPIFDHPMYNLSSQRLSGKVAVITGGDSGIGRAVSLAYVKAGAKVAIVYFNEEQDANYTKQLLEQAGGEVLLIKGDISNEDFCKQVVKQTINTYGHLEVVVNNAAVQFQQNSIEAISMKQLEQTFKVNVFAAFYLIKAAIPYLKAGDSIINTTSITAYQGHETLIDYASTKGALTTLTRSLAKNLASKAIRVNAVAPGPIWTPLIPASFNQEKVAQHGANTPLGRAGQPVECAGAYVYLASDEASYITGQTIHINGGEVING